MNLVDKIKKRLTDFGIESTEGEYELSFGEDAGKKVKYVVGKYQRGREIIELNFFNQISEAQIDESQFEKYKFLQDYEAIWSPSLKVIECEIIPTRRFIGTSDIDLKLSRLFGRQREPLKQDNTDLNRYEFEKSESGLKISIGRASIDFAILSYSKERRGPSFDFSLRRPTIKIENIEITQHDATKELLEKIGNSFLFKLDISINFGYQLAIDRELKKGIVRRNKTEHEIDLEFPNYEYDMEPMSLYWYARSAFELPLLQFLAYYQILEFYFTIFSEKEVHQKIRNYIKDPRFNPNKDSDLTKLLNVISLNKNSKGFGNELEQLKATLKHCIDIEDIRDFLEFDEKRKQYFLDKKNKNLSSKRISISNVDADLISEVSERLYEIRCRIVHTKSGEKEKDLLLPFSSELKEIRFDIELIEFLSIRAIISSSRPLKV